MTQAIAVYNQENELIYYTVHERNGKYLERETESDQFEMLGGVDDCDPSSFWAGDTLVALIQELDLVVSETQAKGDLEMGTHIKEIMVLCRLCLWNLGKFSLVMSPFGYLPENEIPEIIPKKFLSSISNAGLNCMQVKSDTQVLKPQNQ